jgi:nitrate/nitrite-specific signal transduction histidine kinase
MPDGRPVLVNRQMNRLAVQLTGHTVLDAETTWNELRNLTSFNGCSRLEKPWTETAEEKPGELLGFSLPDGTMWQFRREMLKGDHQTYLQIEAADVTEMFRLSKELYENNRRLQALHERQKVLLSNIAQINREKELLSVKMRVHDEFGQCLLATSQSLRGGTLAQDDAELAKGWADAVRDFTNIPLEDSADGRQQAELEQVASMIGCRLEFSGALPDRTGTRRLLYAAVREALTNAVRHAGADVLSVRVRRSAGGYHAEISDNGRSDVSSIREGDGLRNLRSRLEQEGATLEIDCRQGVVLILEFPEGGKDEGKRGT